MTTGLNINNLYRILFLIIENRYNVKIEYQLVQNEQKEHL